MQHWTVTSYVLLLDGAVIGLGEVATPSLSTCKRLVLCIAASVLVVAGLWFLWLHSPMKTGRNRVGRLRSWERDVIWLLGPSMIAGDSVVCRVLCGRAP